MDGKPYSGGSTSLNDFQQVSLLGEGAYSAVYKVVRLADKETYALKKVKLPSLSDKEKQNALNEVRLLASVQHRNIVAYKEAFFDEGTRCLCIVQEYADGGDLFQQITKCQKEKAYLREADVWRYLHGMCQGLKALHDMRILHRDLKCANVFLHNGPDGMMAKLGDFNVSKVAKRGLCITQTGTPYYASPEVWRDMPYDAKSDMWSLGCVLYEMLALKPPFRAEDMEGLYKKVLRGQYHRLPTIFSQGLSEVIATLLQVNPRHRPSVDQLLQLSVMRRHAPNSAAAVQVEELSPSSLLNTIKLPKNAIDLSGCLPKPRYDLPKIVADDPSRRFAVEPVPDNLQAYWQQQQQPPSSRLQQQPPSSRTPQALASPPQLPPPRQSPNPLEGTRAHREQRDRDRRADRLANLPDSYGPTGRGRPQQHVTASQAPSQRSTRPDQAPSGGLKLPRIVPRGAAAAQ